VQRTIGLLIAVLLLGYGLVRIGVGALLMAQTLDLINISELAEAVSEVKQFIDARTSDQIFPFSMSGYFGYILAMGALLTIGAAGAITRNRWGFTLLGFYLAMHAALFINFQEVNPKLIVLILQVVMLFALYYLRPPRSEN